MQLLHPLQVIGFGWRVGDGPQTQVMHVAQHAPGVLEGNLHTLLFSLDAFVGVSGHADVVGVADGLTHVLRGRLENRQLVHIFMAFSIC